jgi:RNA polymerase sigma-70 factor (ECF subfamily)
MSALVLRPFLAVAAPALGLARRRVGAGAQAAQAPLTPPEAARFRELMLPHLDAAHGFARFLARDPTAADDLVQEAYLAAFRGFRGYRGGGARAWLFAVLRSCFLTQARRDRPWADAAGAEAIDEVPDPGGDPESLLLRASDDASVRAAVEALPEPFREAIVLRELQEMSYREIAEITEAPIGTVMSRLARARRLLAATLCGEALP